jgi:hypothetical protein
LFLFSSPSGVCDQLTPQPLQWSYILFFWGGVKFIDIGTFKKNERNQTIFTMLKKLLKMSYYSWTKKTGWDLLGYCS